jgi:hypothetical protein
MSTIYGILGPISASRLFKDISQSRADGPSGRAAQNVMGQTGADQAAAGGPRTGPHSNETAGLARTTKITGDLFGGARLDLNEIKRNGDESCKRYQDPGLAPGFVPEVQVRCLTRPITGNPTFHACAVGSDTHATVIT